ncbi:MAG: YbbR-like domain-containing protein [Thermodesulfobacteriota bacterium]
MKGTIFSNFWLKILALALSTLLWFLVVGERGTEIGFLIPLELKGIPADMVVTSNPPREVEVRVTGPKTLLSNLSPGQISVVLDMSKAVPGINKFSLMNEQIKAPRGISVIRLNPSFIKIKTEKLQSRELAVKVKLTGTVAEGYALTESSVEPEKIEAVGTRNQLRRLKSISTTTFDVSGITSDETVSLSLELPESGLTKLTPDSVVVTIKVIEKQKSEEKKEQ